jgi:hypothetical protein
VSVMLWISFILLATAVLRPFIMPTHFHTTPTSAFFQALTAFGRFRERLERSILGHDHFVQLLAELNNKLGSKNCTSFIPRHIVKLHTLLPSHDFNHLPTNCKPLKVSWVVKVMNQFEQEFFLDLIPKNTGFASFNKFPRIFGMHPYILILLSTDSHSYNRLDNFLFMMRNGSEKRSSVSGIHCFLAFHQIIDDSFSQFFATRVLFLLKCQFGISLLTSARRTTSSNGKMGSRWIGPTTIFLRRPWETCGDGCWVRSRP